MGTSNDKYYIVNEELNDKLTRLINRRLISQRDRAVFLADEPYVTYIKSIVNKTTDEDLAAMIKEHTIVRRRRRREPEVSKTLLWFFSL